MQQPTHAQRTAYVTVEVAVGPLTPTGYALTIRAPGGEAQGRLTSPTADPDYQALVERLARLESDAAGLAALGRMLFNALLQGEARDVYRATQALLAEGQRLRIVLSIPAEAAPIAALPWEFLADPAAPGALAVRGISVVRYLPQPARVPALEVALPLRVLLTAAETPPQANVQRELAAIQAALAPLGRQAQVTVAPHLTAAALQDRLREGFHVWHFVGHGERDPQGEVRLMFEDEGGDVDPVGAARLGALLGSSGVRLVVLNACHGAQIGDQMLQSVAPALIAAGVPAVVGMQFATPAESARVFAAECYEALAAGLPIDACVTEGRRAVLNTAGDDRPDWGIPVVLTRALDGRLFTLAASAAPAASGPATRDERNRRAMLALVRRIWIAGVLDPARVGLEGIAPEIAPQPDAVVQPWGAIVQQPAQAAQALPAGARILDVFDDQGGALLILGAPGSGKTIALLDLARDLLDRAERDPSEAIPVVFNLASWAARRAPLAEWLVDELNARYDVPRAVGQAWVAQDQVIPLLDGLDEAPAAQREACVAAINAFRQDHGLLPLAVCSRSAEYAELSSKLRLRGAIVLRPLTPEQIDAALAQAGPERAGLRAALQADAGLRELADTPLMLSIMLLAYRDGAVDAAASPDERRGRLFAAYVEHMLARRGLDARYSRAQVAGWLGWLARAMQQQSQSVFLIERMQPDWLPTQAGRRGYWALTRPVGGLLVGLAAGLPAWALGVLLSTPALGLGCGVLAGLLSGLAAALFDGADAPAGGIPQIRRIAPNAALGGLAIGVIGGLAIGALGGLVLGVLGGVVGALIGAVVGALSGRPALGLRRIVVVERLRWSWRRAWRVALGSGAIGALGVGLLVGAAIALGGSVARGLASGALFGLLFGLGVGLLAGALGGLEGGAVQATMRPNQGVWRSARSALLSSGGSALLLGALAGMDGFFAREAPTGVAVLIDQGLIINLSIGPALGVVVALTIGPIVALAYGGYACLAHLALRLGLWRAGATPWNYARFLDYAAERVLLRKVGGGYIFIHRRLLDYFAAQPGAPPDSDLGSRPKT